MLDFVLTHNYSVYPFTILIRTITLGSIISTSQVSKAFFLDCYMYFTLNYVTTLPLDLKHCKQLSLTHIYSHQSIPLQYLVKQVYGQ